MSIHLGQPDVARRALASAGIAPERCGPARPTHLSDGQRTLYRWILASFAHDCPPRADELSDLATEVDLRVEETLDLFREARSRPPRPSHRPSPGRISVLRPAARPPRAHQQRRPGGGDVLAGSACCDGPSYRSCCDVLNLFKTEESANGYLGDHPGLAGFTISIPDAIEARRTVFADLISEH